MGYSPMRRYHNSKAIITIALIVVSGVACTTQDKPATPIPIATEAIHQEVTPIKGNTIATRFPTPKGYQRIPVPPSSFAAYLRNLPLKSPGSPIGIYDGTTIASSGHEAVIDLPIGQQDLHQCADAIMRLRAEYFYINKKYDNIHFNFTNGMRVDYNKWKQGYRMQVNGNKTQWVHSAEPEDSYESFWAYLELIFMYAGTASLEKELEPRAYADMQIGDVLIIGGFPGHAVIIVDMAEKVETGEKLFMVAQSFMPAQDLHIIISAEAINPWYYHDKPLQLSSWDFDKSDLRHF